MYTKLKELMLYIATQSVNDPAFGSLKLNRILFLIDFTAFGVWGKPVTETVYIHQKTGPVPRDLLMATEALIDDKSAIVQQTEYLGNLQKRLIALRAPDMSLFNEEERRLINDGINALKLQNGTQAGEWRYGLRSWLATKTDEEIPFFTTFLLEENPVDQDDLAWAKAEIAKLRSEA